MSDPTAYVEVDAVPVPARLTERALIRAPTPVTQAILAAGGFIAGAAVVGLVGHRRSKRARGSVRRGRRTGKAGSRKAADELVRIVGSRSLLVDVHLLDAR